MKYVDIFATLWAIDGSGSVLWGASSVDGSGRAGRVWVEGARILSAALAGAAEAFGAVEAFALLRAIILAGAAAVLGAAEDFALLAAATGLVDGPDASEASLGVGLGSAD